MMAPREAPEASARRSFDRVEQCNVRRRECRREGRLAIAFGRARSSEELVTTSDAG
jgi:hypothetical protein